uniref:Uncharacterized protein n=1 Tax=Arundo donax TaxID=35708 RepID=A0A0A8ZGJ0_ARUDO
MRILCRERNLPSEQIFSSTYKPSYIH